jgi:aldose sugar dehydrogenase
MTRFLFATASVLLSTPAVAQDAADAGASHFNRHCVACHVAENEAGEVLAGRNARIGPNLYGVAGAAPAHRDDFDYSPALVRYGESGATWEEENFVSFIQNPNAHLQQALGEAGARSKMAYRLPNAEQGREIYLFLAQLSGSDTATAGEDNADAGTVTPEDDTAVVDVDDAPTQEAVEGTAVAPDETQQAQAEPAAPASTGAVLAGSGMNATRLQHSVVIDGLNRPWDMAFLDDGTMFFTETCLGLSVRMPSGDVNKLLGMVDSEGYDSTADDLFCEGQAGMMGVAVDPDFDQNRRIYVYATSTLSTPHTNRLMRLEVNEDFTAVAERTDIVDDVPYKMAASDQPFGGPGAHNGGRVRFGPEDGFIYLTTGDNHNAEVPQSPTLMGSKVLRIDTDGNAAEGNTPPEGFDPRTYTYGHRNVQGIAFHPETSTPITVEHGPWHSDEITVLRNGGNGGWDPRPNMAGRGECPSGYCGYEPNQNEGMNRYERASSMPMTDLATYPDAMRPIWDNNGYSQGMASATFLEGEQWGSWNGHMVVGFMGIGFGGTPIGQRIDVIQLDGTDEISVVDITEMTLPMESARFRSLVLGPDGSLYAAVDEGAIHRLTPAN